MSLYDVLDQIVALLRKRQRLTYRLLKREFALDDETLEDLKDELIEAQQVARDEDHKVLVWIGRPVVEPPEVSTSEPVTLPTDEPEREPLSYTPQHLAEKILTSRSALEGERKQVTVLFCDLQNSTPLAEKIGPENMHALLNHFFELALSEVHRYEGTINQFLGDGFMALFGAPIAHEDHARRGVLAALGLQRVLKEANSGAPYGVEWAFRMGLNAGLVVVASIGDNLRMDYTAVGDTTNLAARLQTQAEPGEILVSESTARLVEGYLRLEHLEPVEVKGKTDPVSVYKVLGTLPRRSPIVSRSERTLSQFVGRARELAILEELFAQVESGNGQVAGIVAEAGQGKSRLLYEFRQRLSDKHVTYLEGRCLSYGSSIPYHPIIDIVRHNCRITEADGPDTIIEKVGIALQEVGMAPEASAPYLLQLLGVKAGMESMSILTPEAIRIRTFETLTQMSLNGAQHRPLVFEVEDLHWQDQTSEDYMASLVESLAGAPILLLTTYRPGYQPPWLGKSYVTQIALHGLTQQDALTIIRSSHPTVLSDDLAHTIVEKAEGNPFFLEELTHDMAEANAPFIEIPVPDTIQGVLSARIDRLPESHKRLLQIAAVLGREFTPRLLGSIWDGSDVLEPLLQELKRLEFLFERRDTGDTIYVFKHALTQDVAYESLLTTHRQALHTQVGQALETLYANRLEEAYDRLAYHYAKTEDAPKAIEYLTFVSEKAARVYAHAEAVATLREALVHAACLPEASRDRCVIELSIRQAESLFWSGQRQAILDLYQQNLERLKGLKDPLLTGRFYLWLGFAYAFLGQRENARQILQRALMEATQGGDVALMGQVRVIQAQEMNFSGSVHQAMVEAQQAVTLLEGTEERFWLGTSLYFLGLSYVGSGNFHHAVETATRLHHLSDMIGDRRLQVNALIIIGLSSTAQGDGRAGIEALQAAIAMSPDAFETALALVYLGRAYLVQGDLDQAVSTLEQAIEQADQYRSRQVQSTVRVSLGEAYFQSGQIEKGYDLVHQGFELAKRIQAPRNIAIAKRSLGRLAFTNGNLEQAKAHFDEALSLFASAHGWFEVARTHLDLSTLAHTQGNDYAATTHLSTAHAWFQRLHVPRLTAHVEQLAQEYGVTLTEVEIEAFETEGEV